MKKIIVRGPALSRSGYGEQCRFALRSLRKFEDIFDVYLLNTNWGRTGWTYEDTEERRWIDQAIAKTQQAIEEKVRFDYSLQVTIPNEWEKIAEVNVGYTAGIETTKIAPQWVEKSQLMDRIIVVSEHAKYGFVNTSYDGKNETTDEIIKNFKCNVPIQVINYPVKDIKPEKIELDFPHDFNFLVVAQWSVRKNIENTIEWFIEEFYDREVGLVLKLTTANGSHMDRDLTHRRIHNILKKFPERACKIHLLHGDLTEGEMTCLYNHPKIKGLISLSHGEGFGLPMFEAAYNELPVITMAWSGQVDFLYMPEKNKKGKIKKRPYFARVDYDLKPIQKEAVWDGVLNHDSMWAFPKAGNYKMVLRDFVKKYDFYKKRAGKLKKWIEKEFEEEKQYRNFAESVYGSKIIEVSAEDLPKISIITSVYDGDDFIESFLEDMTNQTIFEEKCELVIINAASPGNEEKVIQKYIEKYPKNIVYKKLDKDPGIYGTWNEALKLASGEYVTNANLDDRKRPDSIEKHAKALFANEDVDLTYADSFLSHKPNITFKEYMETIENKERYKFSEFSKEAMLRGNQVHNNPMWKKTLHDKHGLFDDSFFSAGDWEFFLRCTFGGAKFMKINDVLGVYYFNPKGISTNPENEKKKMKEELSIYKKYQKIYMEEHQR